MILVITLIASGLLMVYFGYKYLAVGRNEPTTAEQVRAIMKRAK